MARQIYKMKVVRIRDFNPNFRQIFLRCIEPANFEFKAGQFVMLHVPQEPKPALRAYSIASDDRDKGGLDLIFKLVEGGVASRFIWSLKGDEVLDFTGPFGRVLFKEPPTEQIIMLNTGSGVSQHLCYLLSKAEAFPQVKFKMLFGLRHESDIYYKEDLDQLVTKLPNFSYEYVLSRPEEGWAGKKGYVQNFIEDYQYLKTPTTFYLCGNGGMIKDVKARLESVGFDKSFIFSEAFD